MSGTKPLETSVRAVTRARDKAAVKAESILGRIKIDDILQSIQAIINGETGETIFSRAMQAVLKEVKPERRSAFTQARINAWNLIGRTVGFGPGDREFINKNKRVISEPEQRFIAEITESVIDDFRAKSIGFIAEMEASVKSMNKRGMSMESIREQLETDWRQRGIITGQWQRAVIQVARDMATEMGQAGREAGYNRNSIMRDYA